MGNLPIIGFSCAPVQFFEPRLVHLRRTAVTARDTSSRTTGTTPGHCRSTWDTGTSPTRWSTPSCRTAASRTSGATEVTCSDDLSTRSGKRACYPIYRMMLTREQDRVRLISKGGPAFGDLTRWLPPGGHGGCPSARASAHGSPRYYSAIQEDSPVPRRKVHFEETRVGPCCRPPRPAREA
jgi:hypothetical protein